MNISTYIFGSLGNGYSQYPNDYAQTIFQSIYAQSSVPTQIVVHREDKLIYYAYVRKLEAGQYVGLCVVLNSVMLTDFKEMFSIFENLITSLVVNGIILQFNDKGDIVSKASQLYTNQAEVSRVTDNLRNEFSKLENTSKPLPPVSYGIAKNEKRTFSISDNINELVKASVSYNYTFIFKQKDFDTQSLNSYRSVLSRLNETNLALKKENAELQEKNQEILRQKKQFKNVIFLILVVVGCLVGLYLFYNEVNYKAACIADLEHTVTARNATIADRDSTIVGLQASLSDLYSDLETITSYSASTGATLRNNDNHDNGWILWLNAKKKVRIESFYIKGQTSGTVDIGLFDTNDNLIASYETNATRGEFRKVDVGSEWIIESGTYYMKIRSGVSLQYHSSNDKEYSQFSGGALAVTGACSYNERNEEMKQNNHSYYQYFYNIQYHILFN